MSQYRTARTTQSIIKQNMRHQRQLMPKKELATIVEIYAPPCVRFVACQVFRIQLKHNLVINVSHNRHDSFCVVIFFVGSLLVAQLGNLYSTPGWPDWRHNKHT